MTAEFINDEASLAAFCDAIADSDWLTVDTEFLREKTYYPQLCLIQVANASHVACIDPIAIKDLSPLLTILYRPDITLVFHAARQDLELLYLLEGCLPSHVFDTQLAATALGYGDQIGYGNLVKQCLGVELEKAHSRADWSKRPLTDEQIAYAADDVIYLRDIYQLLLTQLQQKNRLHWLQSDIDTLCNTTTYEPILSDIWKKIKGSGRLKGIALVVLQQLAIWREQRAIDSNRPRRWILKDEVMLDLAKLMPTSKDKLSHIRGLEANTIDRFGSQLLAIVADAKTIPKSEWPTIKKPTILTPQQDAVVDSMMALLRHFCHEQAITPAAVASRKDIERVVSGETDIDLLTGWRDEVVGHHLRAFLAGELTLSATNKKLTIIQQG